MIRSLKYEVVGEEKMHCGGCESRVEAALKRLDGVRDVQASAADQQVTVTIDNGTVTPEQVAQRLARLGYEVKKH